MLFLASRNFLILILIS